MTLRDIRNRIRSVKNIQQVTRAMEMVAAAKLRRAQARVVAGRPYASRIAEMLRELGDAGATAADGEAHPYMVARPVKKRLLILVTADRGFCGSFNSILVRNAMQRARAAEPGSLAFVLVGKKGADAFRRAPYEVMAKFPDVGTEISPALVGAIADTASGAFLSGAVDAVDIIYMRFISALNRKLVDERLLPVSAEDVASGMASAAAGGSHATPSGGFILEPSPEEIFRVLMPRYLRTRIFSALRESSASEQGARMIAMGSATRNAEELVSGLTLEMNRARQAAITKELAEIVGSAEAMK